MRRAIGLSLAALVVGLMASAAPARADFWSDAGAKYKGVTLHGVTESTPPSNYIKDVLAPEFEKKTGIKVEIETTSWDQMYDKAIKDMEAKTGIYDMVYIEQDIIYAYLARNFLVDVTKSLKDDASLKAPDFDESHFTTFANYFKNKDGDLFGVPMEAFIKVYLYRKDLFDDAAAKEAFKKETGKDLAPAKTHEDYTQIAEFFTKWGKDHGGDLWGTTAQAHTGHPASWYEFFESVAPTFGVYNWGIDANNNYAASVANGGQMNSDKAKAALKYWLHLRDIAPPESASSTWTEVATTFAAGRAAQGLVYGENAAWIASDPSKSKVVGKVGVALPPVEPGVMEDAENGKGYIGYYDGGAFGLPVTSKNKEAALLFLQYIGQDSVQSGWAVAAPRITNTATYDDPGVKKMDQELGGYYTMLKDDGKLFAGAPPYPFHAQVREATAPIFYQILTGEVAPDEGLDKMAAAAEDELTNLGYRQ
ncbi:extracellular solute-binding protein [Aureimonas leprariae]|uniref:Extracellular solute-binding protein n=1 Tax=Plantimonas leprariae TaxID=2615207 RepID=A0A7V7PM11_9HYPH|nr:extracellular solute-binding protein [Aureimonas leprariae]KAB0677718.1 extracellular solute-binding protein [Aureimonas leprariae]